MRLKQVADALSRRTGVPLTVAAGTAVCPEDGLEAPALAAHADIGLFAERAELAASRRGGAGETSA